MADPIKSNPSAVPSAIRTLAPPAPQASSPQQPGGVPKSAAVKSRKPANFSSVPFWTGLGASIGWVAMVVLALVQSGAAHTFGGIPLASWSIGICAIASPVALIWMVTAYLQRAADVQAASEPLRRQLSMITGESGAAEVRIRRFNQAVREQIDLLRSTQAMTQSELMSILDRVRQHQNDLERFESNSVHQVKEVQDVIRRSMQHIEQVMDDKFTMLRVLDGKLSQSGDGLARQTETVREHISNLLQNVEANAAAVSGSLDSAMRDSKKLADTARMQETSLLSAAENASVTMHELSGKIDTDIARFLQRASSAREEAERLASALDTQTRSIDEFSQTMPIRISEAETVLRGVSERLYASEKLAREQAVVLGDKLAERIEGLQGVMDGFGTRFNEIDGNLQRRSDDLGSLVARVAAAAGEMARQMDAAVVDLGNRAEGSMKQFATVNEGARRSVDDITTQLAEVATRYEFAIREFSGLSETSEVKWRIVADEIATQIAQFDMLRNASQFAGEEVQTRASAALQNLQHILERLLVTRDATETVGEALTAKLGAALDQNEHVIIRINEAAAMAVHALGIAAESLARRGDGIVGHTQSAESAIMATVEKLQSQASAVEKTLREQNSGLVAILEETRGKLDAAERHMQDFGVSAAIPVQRVMEQIEQGAVAGGESLSRYCDNMQGQLGRLQEFNARVGGMGEEVGRMTTETLQSIEGLNSRFIAVRAAQDETARSTLEQFGQTADRLQREVGSLSDLTAQAVERLKDAAANVSQQSQRLHAEAVDSGSNIQMVIAALQDETAQVRTSLQKQADGINNDLARSEKQFIVLGDSLKQRTDTAYALLDRVSAHYNEVTRAATEEFESRAGKLEKTAMETTVKVDALTSTIGQQLDLIGTGAARIESHAAQITGASGKTLQQLSLLNEKFAVTQESTANGAQNVVARLDEVNAAFQRQSNGLGDAAQNAVLNVQKAGNVFGEQSGRLLESAHNADQAIRSLSAATTAFADQSTQVRATMEQHNHRLITSLNASVNDLDIANSKLQQTMTSAASGADHVQSRFSEMTQTASGRMGSSSQELMEIAAKTESALGSLGANVTQQVASLNLVSEQIGEQHRAISAANENQRAQLVALFEQLGSAHGEASDVAERTIVRLNDSLQHIQRQLGALSDQSQAAIGAVRAAGTGFADQAGLLIQHAQQAEQQARTVLTVSSALEDQARQLRESLHAESERSREILSNLLGRIGSGNTELRDIGTMAEATLTSLYNSFNGQAASLNTTMQQMSDRQRSLTTSLDSQRDVLNGLLNRLTLAQDETAAVAERNAVRLSESTAHITRQMENIDTQAQNTLASVRAAGIGFADEAGVLIQHAQQAEQQTRSTLSATSGMQEQARSLREAMQSETAHVIESLVSIIAQLDTTGQQLRKQSGSIVNSLDQSMAHFASTAKSTGETLRNHAEDLTAVADLSEERVIGAAEKLRGNFGILSEAGDLAEMQARKLADTAENATSRLAIMRDTLSASEGEGGDILDRASARIDDVRTALQRELKHVEEVSQQAVERVTLAGQELATQSDTLRANLASSESSLVQAATLVREESVQLPSVLERSAARIEETGKTFSSRTEEINGEMVKTADRFIGVTGAVRDTIMDEMKHLASVAESADQTLRSFGETLAGQVATIKQSSASMSSDQSALIEKTSATMSMLSSASERLAKLRGETIQTTEKLAREFDAIETRATATTQRLSQAGEGLGKQALQLSQITERAEGQMLGASQSFREQVERIRSGVQVQIDDINRGLMQITAQLERTGSTLRTATANTVVDVEKVTARFDQASKDTATQLTDRTARMRVITEELAKLIFGFGQQIDGMLDRLAKAGNGVKQNESDLIGQLQVSLTNLGKLAERLDSGRILTADISDEAITRMTEVAEIVEKQMQTIKDGSETVTGIVRGVGKMYADQTQGMNRSVVEAQSQVLVMNKSMEEMQQRADRMRVSLKLQGDELTGSLAQILRQLSETGDTMSDTVNLVLQQQAEQNLQKIS